MTARGFLEARLYLYRLLGALYRYPLTAEKLSSVGQLIELSNVGQLNELLCLERLNVEMTRLLEGPGVTPAVPYASYYLHGKQLMGPSAQAARRFYLEWGVEPEQGSIPPDHIALELGFLSFLAEQALEDDRREDALSASLVFIQEHLQPWLSSFCIALKTAAREPFFRALAAFTRQFISIDVGQLIELSQQANVTATH